MHLTSPAPLHEYYHLIQSGLELVQAGQPGADIPGCLPAACGDEVPQMARSNERSDALDRVDGRSGPLRERDGLWHKCPFPFSTEGQMTHDRHSSRNGSAKPRGARYDA